MIHHRQVLGLHDTIFLSWHKQDTRRSALHHAEYFKTCEDGDARNGCKTYEANSIEDSYHALACQVLRAALIDFWLRGLLGLVPQSLYLEHFTAFWSREKLHIGR